MTKKMKGICKDKASVKIRYPRTNNLNKMKHAICMLLFSVSEKEKRSLGGKASSLVLIKNPIFIHNVPDLTKKNKERD